MSKSIKIKAVYQFFGQALVSGLIFLWLAVVPKALALIGFFGVVLMLAAFLAYWAIHRHRAEVSNGWNTLATFFDLFCMASIFALGLLGFVLWLEYDGLSTRNITMLGSGILGFLALPPVVTASLVNSAQKTPL